MRKILLLFIIFSGISRVTAQVFFQAFPQKKEVELNEPIHIQFILSIKNKDIKEIGNIKLPIFTNAQITGRQIIQNQSYDEEGNITVEYGEEIGLRAIKTGNVKIGSAFVKVDGKTYHTKPLTITVVGDDVNHEAEKIPPKVGKAFLSLKVSEKNPYQNEGVTAQLKFYTRRIEMLNSMTHLAPPNFHELFVKPVRERNNTYEQEVINGEIYFSRVVSTYVMFPSRPGTTVIDPFTLSVTIPDGFFNEQEIYIQSAPVTLQVKKLPENSPDDFYGVVGDYTLRAASNKKELKTEEAVTVQIEIEGRGNIELIKVPEIVAPEDMEQFNSKNKMELSLLPEGITGKVSASTVLIPHKEGEYDIHVGTFSFFDPKEGIFKKLSVEPITLTVLRKSVADKKDSTEEGGGIDSGRIKAFVPDIHVKDVISVLDGKTKNPKRSWVFILIGIIVIMIVTVYFRFIRKKKSKEEKSGFDSPQPLTEQTKKKSFAAELFKLKKIAEKGDDKKEFYTLLESVLQEAVSQNLNITKEQFITSAEIEEILSNKLGDEFSDEWKNMVLKSQIERYSGISDKDSLLSVYAKAEELIKKLS
ncbi:MAG: BatD family protein [Flavobacteriaceae bacterium]|jgi:hypothetical protein|nr:BatD family protein [Flavobacteriaceae bacterium]